MRKNYIKKWVVFGVGVTLLSQARMAAAQMEMDPIASKHTELSPERRPAAGDSARALKLAGELREAIGKYKDTAVAEADGYHMFLPGLKNQKIYHFTNNARGFEAAFHFNPSKPTSLLYKRGTDGKLVLVGAMYTMPKNATPDRLNDRVPLSIARWHKHVNWCMPKKGDDLRWLETRDGHSVFGPESPISTKVECDAVRGAFYPNLFGWMIHANVFEGTDLATVFGMDHHVHEHGG
jgi:hypothetical protein